MTEPAYGAWPSPIDARMAAVNDGRPEWPHLTPDALWWCEPRPEEGGRTALLRRGPDGEVETVLPATLEPPRHDCTSTAAGPGC